MINFRYHVVSLTAVFLALAIGLVVGTAAGNGPVADSLRGEITALSEQKDQLRGQVKELTDEANRQEDAWDEAAATTLPGKLAGKRVLVVSFASSAKHVDGVARLLGAAGAKVTGRIKLEDKFLDPTKNEELLDLALQAAPPGVRGALPSNSNGVETSTSLLAAVLVGGAPVEGSRSVLGAYQSFLAVAGDPAPAEAVVMLAGPPYTGSDAVKRNAGVLTIIKRFDQAGKLVVAAPAVAGEGNAVRGVRNDPDLSKRVSTVDNVSTALGRFSTALTLAERLDGGNGHYGFGTGATSVLPESTGRDDA